MQKRTIMVSELVWKAIAARGNFGETEDDVLRREFKLPTNSDAPSTSSGSSSDRHNSGKVAKGSRKRRASRSMSTDVRDNKLHVAFHDGPSKSWDLPPKSDKIAIRKVRDKAVTFAIENGATYGQQQAVKKALTNAEFHLTK